MYGDNRTVLLNNLMEARNIIYRAEDTTRRYNDLMSRIRNQRQKREYVNINDRVTTKAVDLVGKMGFIIGMGIVVLILVISFFSVDPKYRAGYVRSAAIFIVIFYLIHFFRKKRKAQKRAAKDARGREAAAVQNQRIDQENSMIAAENEAILRQAQEVDREMTEIRALAAQRLGWYPPDYLYSHAVNYFIDAVNNYRANTIGEAVNLYVEELRHREHMEKLDTLNILTAMNLFTNMQILDAVHENTNAIHQEASQTRDFVHQENEFTRNFVHQENAQNRNTNRENDAYYRGYYDGRNR